MADKGRDFPATAQFSAEELAARKQRNVWLALALVAFCVLVGAITVVRLGDTDGKFYYHNDPNSDEAGQELPPGMTPDQAAPPPGLTPEPSGQ